MWAALRSSTVLASLTALARPELFFASFSRFFPAAVGFARGGGGAGPACFGCFIFALGAGLFGSGSKV